MGVFIKLGHIVKVFHGEDIAELFIENVSIGLTSTVGEPVLLERGYACCIIPLAFDQTPQVFCRVFSNDVFHKLLVSLNSITFEESRICNKLKKLHASKSLGTIRFSQLC